MFEEYIPICFTVKHCEEIKGRKKFQKIFYLAKREGMPIKETFEWNNYGPFSRELATEIDYLHEMGFLSEEKSAVGEYSYGIEAKGKEFLRISSSPDVEAVHNHFEKILVILNDYDGRDLEKMASIAFLIDKGYDDPYIENFLEYTKKYSTADIEKGKEMLLELSKKFD